MYITVQFLVILSCILLVKCGMGRKAMLSVIEKKEVLAHKDNFPGTSQRNLANPFSVLWDKPFSHCSIGDILSEKNKWKNLTSGNMKKLKGVKHKKLKGVLAILIW
jgi:hypothetical protein